MSSKCLPILRLIKIGNEEIIARIIFTKAAKIMQFGSTESAFMYTEVVLVFIFE